MGRALSGLDHDRIKPGTPMILLSRATAKRVAALGALLALLSPSIAPTQRVELRNLPLTLRQFRDLSAGQLEPQLTRVVGRRGYRLVERRQSGALMLLVMRGAPRQVTGGLCELDQLEVRMRPRPRSGRVAIPTQHILDVPLVLEAVSPSKVYHVTNPDLLESSHEQLAQGDDCRDRDPAQSPAFAAADQGEARLAANALTALQRALRREQIGFPISCPDDTACSRFFSTLSHGELESVDRSCERTLTVTAGEQPRCLTLRFHRPRNPPWSVHYPILFIRIGPQARVGAAAIEQVAVSFFAPAVV